MVASDERSVILREPAVEQGQGSRALFRAGFIACMPLWAGVVPFAVAFAILARTAGYSLVQTQALSLLVFAGSAQVAVVTLSLGGSGAIAIFLAAVLLNLRHVLYSLSLNGLLPEKTRPPKGMVAFLLTDEAYGLTIKAHLDGSGGAFFLAGAGLSLYLAFNVATLAGAVLGVAIPDPSRLGLAFIFPLTFLALLVPLLRSWRLVLVAGVSAGLALLVGRFFPGGTTILISAVVAAGLGAVITGREDR